MESEASKVEAHLVALLTAPSMVRMIPRQEEQENRDDDGNGEYIWDRDRR